MKLSALLVLLGADEPAASSTSPTGSLASEPPPDTSPSAPAELNVAVADVEGMPLPQARAALQDQGMRVRVTRSPSDRARGVVLDQEPTADSDVPKGTVIALFVSGGAKTAAERVEVPDVVGLSASRAVATLREAGLDARVRLVRSSGRPGVVVDQTPGTSSEVATSVVVQLEVTRPRPAVRVEVPDVVGSTAANARRELRAAGLTVMTVAVVSQEPAGTVIEQLPRAGSESRKGTAVKLTVSSGPAMVDVPDVTGLDEASARAELERAGFQVRVTDESTTDPLQDGTVLRQTPQGGSSAEEGAIVTITVARLD